MAWDCAITEDTLDRVSIRCWVRTYRTPFFFEKTLTLTSGSPVLEIDEALVNEGEEPAHCVWGEHIALGPPFLSEDCVIDLPGGVLINHESEHHPNNRLKPGIRSAWPWTEAKDGSQVDASKVQPKTIRAYDMSYVTDMPEGWYAITNQKTGIGFGVHYPKGLFRYLWYWQSFGGGFGLPVVWPDVQRGPRAIHQLRQPGPCAGHRERHRPQARARRESGRVTQGGRLHRRSGCGAHRTRWLCDEERLA